MNMKLEIPPITTISISIDILKRSIREEESKKEIDYILIEEYKEIVKELEECKKELLQSLEY